MISLRLKHVNLASSHVMQNPREVKTKNSKRIDTFFFPVSDICEQVVRDWIAHLRQALLFGESDPLFPKTLTGLDDDDCFTPAGLDRAFWTTAGPVQAIFADAFRNAGLPVFTPHTLR